MKHITQNTKKNACGFTLVELIIVIGIIGILATAVIFLINPFRQIYKSWDAKRKQELSTLQKTFDDYYNDKSSYPAGGDVCYDTPIEEGGGICSCHICGQDPNTPSFLPYLNRLPCDPQRGSKDYLYQYQCPGSQWFKIYADLAEYEGDSYDYGVSSGNVPVEPYPTGGVAPSSTPGPGGPTETPALPTSTPEPSATPTPTLTCPNYPLWCYQTVGQAPQQLTCKFCGYLADCKAGECDQPWQFFTDSYCTVSCEP